MVWWKTLHASRIRNGLLSSGDMIRKRTRVDLASVKQELIKLIAALVGVLLFVCCLIAYLQPSWWEMTMMGPFTGAPFSESLPPQPVSELTLPRSARLQVYEPPDQIVPVLSLRGADGSIVWSRLLVPDSDSNHSVADAFIRDLRLTRLKHTHEGYRISCVCDWAAGHEGGVIYLNHDLSFRTFSLGW